MATVSSLPALEELKRDPQWVCFDEHKVPFSPTTGMEAKANDPATWGLYAQAVKTWRSNKSKYKGLGREFVKEQHYTGIDLDKCFDELGNLSPYARYVVHLLDSYTEYSPSGQGLHIWVRGTLPDNINTEIKADGECRIEAYDCKRYFTVTGKHFAGTPTTIEDRQVELDALYAETMERREAKKPRRGKAPAQNGTGDTSYGLGALDDECRELATTPEGGRNPQLNRCAYKIGQLVGGNALTRITAENALYDAAVRTGLPEREIIKTLRSGIEAGMREPRGVPIKELPGVEYKPTHTMGSESTNGNGHHPPEEQKSTGEPAKAFNRTDLGNAERLVARHGKDMRYCYSMSAWLIWKKTHWQEDKDGHAERLAKKTVRTIYQEAAATPDDHERKELARHALRSESKKLIRDMLALAQSEENVPVTREELDSSPWLLNCANGTLDLQAGTLREHRRDDLLTRCITTPYNPKAACPLWLAFLHTIFDGNTNLITFIQRALGYALTGDTSEQVFFLLYGTGRNGKSTLLEVVQAILTDYAQSAEFKAFLSRDNEGIRNDIARMNGKRLVIAKESDKGKRLAEALVKQLTGGDTITARFLHQEYFDFKPQFKLFLAANHKPEIKGTDLGIWRRVRLIPFTVTITDEEKDKDLPQKLAREAEGILAWLVQGCLDWQQHGLGIPEEVEQATNEYREDMDAIASFLSEVCTFAKNASIGATKLYEAYKKWCEENGERYETQKTFGARLTERGYTRDKDRAGKVYRGLGLLEKEETVNDVNHCEPISDIFEKPQAFVEKTQKKVHNGSHRSQPTQSSLMEGEPQPTPSGLQPELSPVIASLVNSDHYRNMEHWLNKYGKSRPKKVCEECHTFSWYPYWLRGERAWGCLNCQPEIRGDHNAEGGQI